MRVKSARSRAHATLCAGACACLPLLLSLLSLLSLVGLACNAPHRSPPPEKAPSVPAARVITLSVVSTNDLHGRLSPLPNFGGYLDNLRAARAKDGGVLLVDAGDIFQGTLESNSTEGASMIRAMSALGYHAAAIGNHEMDFGPVGPAPIARTADDDPLGALRARVKQAPFPFLSANLRSEGGGALPIAEVKESVLLEVAGVRVGIASGVTRGALHQTHAANVRGLEVQDLAKSVAREAKALRKRGAQLVIAVVHAGGECEDTRNPDDLTSCDPDSEVFELARTLARDAEADAAIKIDLIVAGHTHAAIAHRVAGIPVVEAYSNARAFARVDFAFELPSMRVRDATIFAPQAICTSSELCAAERYEGAAVKVSQRVSQAIAVDLENARELREKRLGVIIGSPILRDSRHESPLNNLVADLLRRAVPLADAAINNGGSVRVSLPKGPLTYGLVYEMFPFDNQLATLELRPSELARIVENSLRGEKGIVALSGVTAKARCEGSELRVTILRRGKPIPERTRLLVVTSDFVVARGDGLLRGVELLEADVKVLGGPLLRDELIKGLSSFPKGRIEGADKALFDPKHPRLDYPGSRPVRCP
jgi:2',3'-cyclic-nucleotide 2'-phosphodiesterase (5'-nucleotidase family)